MRSGSSQRFSEDFQDAGRKVLLQTSTGLKKTEISQEEGSFWLFFFWVWILFLFYGSAFSPALKWHTGLLSSSIWQEAEREAVPAPRLFCGFRHRSNQMNRNLTIANTKRPEAGNTLQEPLYEKKKKQKKNTLLEPIYRKRYSRLLYRQRSTWTVPQEPLYR